MYCHEPIAALPYYVEGIGINIYSLEELCYYIANNTWLLDRSFMTEELCVWVEKQMRAYKLAEKLRSSMRPDGRLSEFVLAILEHTAYQSARQIQEIVATIRQMEEKSELACSKIRADRLMEKEKFLSAIYEYKRILDAKDVGQEGMHFVGTIWHNLGAAYARLFLFEEAVLCFEQAYGCSQEQESLRECLFCSLCMKDEARFVGTAAEHMLDDTAMQELRNELALAMNSGQAAFDKRIDEIARMNEEGQKNEAKQAVSELIFQWKEEYRKSCRV